MIADIDDQLIQFALRHRTEIRFIRPMPCDQVLYRLPAWRPARTLLQGFSVIGPRPVRLQYIAILREQRGLDRETVETSAETPRALYRELAGRHGFTISEERVAVAVNDEIASLDRLLAANDTVMFIPPIAGG